MHGMRFGKNHDTGCVLVQPVNKAGAKLSSNPIQLAIRPHSFDVSRLCDPIASVPTCASGLIHNDQVFVLKQDFQTHVTRNKGDSFRANSLKIKDVTTLQGMVRFDPLTL
jgi:hypothetical protein